MMMMMTMMTTMIGYVLLLLHHKGSQQHWCHQDSRKKKHPHVTAAQPEMSVHECAHYCNWNGNNNKSQKECLFRAPFL
jgi:hypothetical protein